MRLTGTQHTTSSGDPNGSSLDCTTSDVNATVIATYSGKQLTLTRPHGSVDVMLGMESRSLHCKDKYQVGNIRLNKNFSPLGGY